MSKTHRRYFFWGSSILLLVPVVLGTISLPANAQNSQVSITEAALSLPDAPNPGSSSSLEEPLVPEHFDSLPASSQSNHIHKYVEPGTVTTPLSPGDKLLLGFRGATYPIPALGWLVSASFSQGLNNSPNYGTGTGAFFQRLGAAAARNSSEGILSDSVMATILHEDPRYYKLGKGHSFLQRLGHAVEHTVITRTDDGLPTVNYSLIIGNAAGSALTNAYYPPSNRGFTPTMKTFGLSLGGSALGFSVAEFYRDALEIAHLQKPN